MAGQRLVADPLPPHLRSLCPAIALEPHISRQTATRAKTAWGRALAAFEPSAEAVAALEQQGGSGDLDAMRAALSAALAHDANNPPPMPWERRRDR